MEEFVTSDLMDSDYILSAEVLADEAGDVEVFLFFWSGVDGVADEAMPSLPYIT